MPCAVVKSNSRIDGGPGDGAAKAGSQNAASRLIDMTENRRRARMPTWNARSTPAEHIGTLVAASKIETDDVPDSRHCALDRGRASEVCWRPGVASEWGEEFKNGSEVGQANRSSRE
jgi:hypothetical protein